MSFATVSQFLPKTLPSSALTLAMTPRIDVHGIFPISWQGRGSKGINMQIDGHPEDQPIIHEESGQRIGLK